MIYSGLVTGKKCHKENEPAQAPKKIVHEWKIHDKMC
jgi:hypothetical protein